jgi:hypothetical protein
VKYFRASRSFPTRVLVLDKQPAVLLRLPCLFTLSSCQSDSLLVLVRPVRGSTMTLSGSSAANRTDTSDDGPLFICFFFNFLSNQEDELMGLGRRLVAVLWRPDTVFGYIVATSRSLCVGLHQTGDCVCPSVTRHPLFHRHHRPLCAADKAAGAIKFAYWLRFEAAQPPKSLRCCKPSRYISEALRLWPQRSNTAKPTWCYNSFPTSSLNSCKTCNSGIVDAK